MRRGGTGDGSWVIEARGAGPEGEQRAGMDDGLRCARDERSSRSATSGQAKSGAAEGRSRLAGLGSRAPPRLLAAFVDLLESLAGLYCCPTSVVAVLRDSSLALCEQNRLSPALTPASRTANQRSPAASGTASMAQQCGSYVSAVSPLACSDDNARHAHSSIPWRTFADSPGSTHKAQWRLLGPIGRNLLALRTD